MTSELQEDIVLLKATVTSMMALCANSETLMDLKLTGMLDGDLALIYTQVIV
jgi:hypothetical protein